MSKRVGGISLLLGGCLAGSALGVVLLKARPVEGASASVSGTAPAGWNREAAARYLDAREVWWQQWPEAQKDHGTICISCHTTVPYALVRPTLGRELGEPTAPATEKRMMDSVEKRVKGWSAMESFYSDADDGPGKTVESHATEAVMNAALLAGYDAQTGSLRPVTQEAFDEAWALQERTGEKAGGWKWQDFHLAPWESTESGYQGAALLMVEAVNAPGGFAQVPENREHLELLRGYLRRGYASEPVLDQLYVLWASAREPGLLTADERKALLAALSGTQESDGGWRTAALDKRVRKDHSPEPAESDGYATGLAVLAMEEAGLGKDDPLLKRGVAWLSGHQRKDGAWEAKSLNVKREPGSDAAPFMSDAATAYAFLALDKAR
jgi:hypothetical protein